MARFFLLLSLLAACSTPDDGGKKDRPPKDTDTDTAADTADTDDTDTHDTDTATEVPDLTTYDGFVEAHAGAYCASLEACDYLDDKGYADRRACTQAVIEFYRSAPCDAYQQDAAEVCVSEDRRMSRACDEFSGGLEPRACQDVCTAPAAR